MKSLKTMLEDYRLKKTTDYSAKPEKTVLRDCWWKEEKDYSLELKSVLQELKINFPLFYSNREHAVRFYFDDYDTKLETKYAFDILSYIFKDKELLFCRYGWIGIPDCKLRRYIKEKEKEYKLYCIDFYEPKNSDEDSYECFSDNITFVNVLPNSFQFQKYAKDIANNYGTNFQLLISVQHKIAVDFYDSRGLDVVCADKNYISELKNVFKYVKSE